jgi:hypothetical protein
MKELLTKGKIDQSASADDAAGQAEEGFWRRRIARADAVTAGSRRHSMPVIGQGARSSRTSARRSSATAVESARLSDLVSVPNIVSPHATWAYSCKRPPSLSRRVTLMSASTGSGSVRRLAWFRARCGRVGVEVGFALGEDRAQVALVHDEDPGRCARGAGSKPAFFKIAQTVAGDTFRPNHQVGVPAQERPRCDELPSCDPAGAEPPTTAKPQIRPCDTIFGTHTMNLALSVHGFWAG